MNYTQHSALLFLFILLVSCNSLVKAPTPMDGVWEQLGYGRIVKIDKGKYLIADVTSISCIPLMSGEVKEFGDAIQLKNDTLTLQDGINLYYFTRTDDAPSVCKKETSAYKEAAAKANNPEYNFKVLWETFKDHYAYFELRNVNPKTMYAKYRPRVTSETSDVELFVILSEMLDEFNDGHIGLDATDEIEEAAEVLIEKQISEAQTISETTESKNKTERLRGYKISEAVAKKYIPNGRSIKGGNLRWGILENNVGYFQVNQMMAVAETHLSDTLSYYEYMVSYFDLIDALELETPEERKGMNNALDKIMPTLENTKAIIIDLRFNGGGKDEVGMDVLRRFNSEEKFVFTKKGRLGSGFTPANKVTQPASDTPYKKPVYLLMGVESASATEIMILSSLSMPNITRIGGNTEGVFSDILDKVLPNGWEFGLSSEVYEDLNGINYEGIGIPPDIHVGYERDTQAFLKKVQEDLGGTGDAAIEKALEMIKN